MSELEKLKSEKAALLVMDYQNDIVSSYVAETKTFLARAKELIHSARESGVQVIYVVVGFRPGYPEISPRNKSFSAIGKSGTRFVMGHAGADVHPDIAPQAQDLRVMKRRVSAFAGSDLELVLRARGIEHLILCGISTSGVVLSTLRQAADLDYQITVVADCCSDQDPELHRVLVDKVFPRQAEVLDAKSLMAKMPR
jgi:nicotinamidase-related amidase